MHNLHKGIKIILELTAVTERLKITRVYSVLTHFVLSYNFIFSTCFIYLMMGHEHPKVFVVLYSVEVTLEIPLLDWVFAGSKC